MVVAAAANGSLFVDHPPDLAEVLNVAGDGDGPLLVEAVLLLRLLEQPREQRVVQVLYRHHEPLLLLLPLPPHPDHRAPLWRRRPPAGRHRR